MKPYDFKWTNFYESNSDFLYSGIHFEFMENELIICSVIIDENNLSILTTRRLLTKLEGQLSIEHILGATDELYGDFKNDKEKEFTFGQVRLQNGKDIKYFIETGNASMIMIHGVRTLIRTNQMTTKQVENVTRIWNRQNKHSSL